jgi:preprotein translocase SecE subunit
VGVAAVLAAWRNPLIHRLSQEVLDELAAVSWPSRQETYTATVVVIVTAVVSAFVIFFLDRFWSWFTDLIFR